MSKLKIAFVLVILTSLIIYLITPSTKPTGLALGQERIESSEQQQAQQMAALIKTVVTERAESTDKILRFNQVKTHGCFNAEFKIKPNLPTHLAQGIFQQPQSYQATLRFANATKMNDTERDIHGLSISVDSKQDFLFNTAPALFAANPQQFHQFIKANAEGSLLPFFLQHPRALINLLFALDKPDNLFNKRFFSATPSRLGLNTTSAVKYSVQPCEQTEVLDIDRNHQDFLRHTMVKHLAEQPACFNFMVQTQTNPDTMPVEDASIEWPQSQSPYVTVATITIPNQTFNTASHLSQCEQMTFNPWNGLQEHQPLGGINRVRKLIYQQLGKYRQQHNQSNIHPSSSIPPKKG